MQDMQTSVEAHVSKRLPCWSRYSRDIVPACSQAALLQRLQGWVRPENTVPMQRRRRPATQARRLRWLRQVVATRGSSGRGLRLPRESNLLAQLVLQRGSGGGGLSHALWARVRWCT